MDAVGSAASVVAVAVTALQSVKFIYDSFHAIKNGPEKLRKVTEAVEHLQRLLEIIKATAERCKESLGQADSDCVRSIEPLLDQCATDLKVFENFLRDLKMKARPHVIDRLTGHFATFLHSKEFKNIHDTLQRHVQLFNSCLSNAGLNVNILMREGLEFLHDEVLTSFEHSDRRFDTLEQQLNSQFQHISSGLRLGQVNITQRLDSQKQQIEDVRMLVSDTNSYKGRSENDTLSKDEQDRTALTIKEGILRRLGDLESRTHVNTALLRDLVKSVQDMKLQNAKTLLPAHSEASSITQATTSKIDGCSCSGGEDLTEELEQSINRLCKQIPLNEPGFAQANSKLIFLDLRRLVAFLFKSVSVYETKEWNLCDYHKRLQRSQENTLRSIEDSLETATRIFIDTKGSVKRKWDDVISQTCDDAFTTRNMEGMLPQHGNDSHEDCAQSNTTLIETLRGDTTRKSELTHRKIKSKSAMQPLRGPHFTKSQKSMSSLLANLRPAKAVAYSIGGQEHVCFSKTTGAGTFIVSKGKKVLPRRGTDTVEPSLKEPSHIQMSFIPRPGKDFTAKVTLDYLLEQTWQRTLYCPTLSFQRVLPYPCKVFDIVQWGSVLDLQKWIARNTRSISVCDPEGRSLLNYAIEANRISMVKTLIALGADVNAMEVDLFGVTGPVFSWFFESAIDDSLPVLQAGAHCLRILLENGADPSIAMNVGCESEPEMWTPFEYQLAGSPTANVQAFLDFGSPFRGPNFVETYSGSESPFLWLCRHYSCARDKYAGSIFETADTLALLLRRGADVSGRDRLGNNCLHLILDFADSDVNSSYARKNPNSLRDILMVLITAGADVYAINDDDLSVSEMADVWNHVSTWNAVLTTCGFEIEEIRRDRFLNRPLSSSIAPELQQQASISRQRSKISLHDYLRGRRSQSSITPIWSTEDLEAKVLMINEPRALSTRPPDWYFDQDDEDGDRDGDGDGDTTASSMHVREFESDDDDDDDDDDDEYSSESDCQHEADVDTDHDLYDSDIDEEETSADIVFPAKPKLD